MPCSRVTFGSKRLRCGRRGHERINFPSAGWLAKHCGEGTSRTCSALRAADVLTAWLANACLSEIAQPNVSAVDHRA